MRFEHHAVDDSPPCGRLFICEPTDLTGDGYPDLIVGGMGAEDLPVLGDRNVPLLGRLFRRLEDDLFWYENPGAGRHGGDSEWTRHAISSATHLHALGGTLGDVNGNGRLDLIVGQGYGHSDIYWFEQPTNPRDRWKRHLVADDFSKYHDLAFGDVDNDGEPEIVGLSQESETVFYYDVPADPYQSPWPSEQLTVVSRGVDVEGLAIVDIDGDGDNELIAGTAIYRHAEATDRRDQQSGQPVETDGGESPGLAPEWTREHVVTGWDWTRVAVGDLDDDGELEIVFAEGDSPIYGEHMGRVGWFDPPDWEPHILGDDLYCPHTVQVADFDGNGSPDVYVAEMGLGENDESAQHIRFHNQGGGEFREEIVETAIPTHEAKAVDVDGDGRLDVVGKSFEPNVHVDVWYNRA
jgi:hypothetical protein